MCNKKWLKKFNEWDPKDKGETTVSASNAKRYCKGFEIGNKGLCKHYMGCQLVVKSRTCSKECGFK